MTLVMACLLVVVVVRLLLLIKRNKFPVFQGVSRVTKLPFLFEHLHPFHTEDVIKKIAKYLRDDF